LVPRFELGYSKNVKDWAIRRREPTAKANSYGSVSTTAKIWVGEISNLDEGLRYSLPYMETYRIKRF